MPICRATAGAAASEVSPRFYPAEQGARPRGRLDNYLGALREPTSAALAHWVQAVAPAGLAVAHRASLPPSLSCFVMQIVRNGTPGSLRPMEK